MSTNRTWHATAGLLAVCLVSGAARADEPAARELLDRRTGTWRTTTTWKPAERTPEEITVSGDETIRWILGGKVQEGKAKDERGIEIQWFANYDSEAEVYRFWYFDSTGAFPRGESVGQRKNDDEATWTMDMGGGVRGTTTWKFTGDDRLDWELVARNGENALVLHMIGSAVRKK